MSGNRGAKGSIKDRLISMLYRMRYKKKELKENDYTVQKKEQQINYLNNLNNFKEKENINILDSREQKELDNIKFDANFKVDADNDKINLKLDSIEYKSGRLPNTDDLKQETKKAKEEIIILKEVNKFVKKSLDNIDDIKITVKELKEESKDKNKDITKIEEKYVVLKNQIEKLNNQFNCIKNKYDLSEFSILESIKLINSIDNYKSLAALNDIDMLLNVCKKEINKIKSITVVYEKQKKVGTDIKEIKEDQQSVKIKFIKSKEQVEVIDSLKSTIEFEIKNQRDIVDSMYEKASYFEKVIDKQIEVIGHKKIFSSLLRIAGGILTIPFTGKNLFGVALGSTMINKGLKELNKKLETREKITINYKYEDISEQISEVKDKLTYTNLILSDSLNEVKKLKNNFSEVFKNYDNILPEYKSALDKINELESRLQEQQFKLLNIDKKLEVEKEINKQKLKKIN